MAHLNVPEEIRDREWRRLVNGNLFRDLRRPDLYVTETISWDGIQYILRSSCWTNSEFDTLNEVLEYAGSPGQTAETEFEVLTFEQHANGVMDGIREGADL